MRDAAEQLTSLDAEYKGTAGALLVDKLAASTHGAGPYGPSPSGLSPIQLVASALGVSEIAKVAGQRDHDALESAHVLSKLEII